MSERGMALGLLSARLLVGLVTVALLPLVCIDDYFRVFHAIWWWDRPSLAPSALWLPGHAYIYGVAVGVTGDSLQVPRLLGLLLHLLMLAVLIGRRGDRAGLVAASWLALAPLPAMLAATALSENLFAVLVVGSVVSLARAMQTSSRRPAWIGALTLLFATWVRYEAWVLTVPFAFVAALHGRRRPAKWSWFAVAFVPSLGPLAWMARLADRRGDPFWFLTGVERDQHGAGDLATAFSGWGAGVAAQALLGLFAAVVILRRAHGQPTALVRSDAYLSARLFAIFTIFAAAFAGWALLRGDVPSQLPARITFPVLLLSAPAVGLWACEVLLGPGAREVPRRALAIALTLALVVVSVGYLRSQPSALEPPEGLAVADLERAYGDGRLSAGDHVLVSGRYPEMTAILVTANRPRHVHVEGVGGRCPVQLLSCSSPCGSPAWAPDVRAVLVAGAAGQDAVRARGWAAANPAHPYRLYLRPPGSAPLCPGPRPNP